MLTCAHCGCLLTAEQKKGKYTYYHCTGGRGECPEKKNVREEVLVEQFGEILRAIHLDDVVKDVLIASLKSSHKDEKAFHYKEVARLQTERDTLQQRIEKIYEDKLDGKVAQELFDRKYQEWHTQITTLELAIRKHRNANFANIEEGTQLLELAQRAYEVYKQQPLAEKRRVLEVVLSNSQFGGGKIIPAYRLPYNLLTKRGSRHQKAKVAGVPATKTEMWLEGESSNLECQNEPFPPLKLRVESPHKFEASKGWGANRRT